MQTLQGEYVLNHEVYLGKDNMDGVDLDANGLGHYVVTSMTRGRGVVVSEVVKPKVIAMYNENMGGVDQSDQMRLYYPTGRSSRKWYWYIFWFLFDVVIGLDKMSATGRRRPKMGLEFRDKLAKQLIRG